MRTCLCGGRGGRLLRQSGRGAAAPPAPVQRDYPSRQGLRRCQVAVTVLSRLHWGSPPTSDQSVRSSGHMKCCPCAGFGNGSIFYGTEMEDRDEVCMPEWPHLYCHKCKCAESQHRW